MPRVHVRTFGCQMNEYDSARMADVLRAAGGYEPTDDPAEADLLLLNTCSVREKAQEKVFSLLGQWRQLKRERPGVIIGVGGCVASQEGEGITERAPFVDLVFGPQTLHRLPEMLGRLRGGRPRGGRRELPRDREVRPAAGAARHGCHGLRVDHGRLQQVLHLLRGAVHARRGSESPARAGDGRGPRARGAGRERNDAARPERQCLSRRARRCAATPTSRR